METGTRLHAELGCLFLAHDQHGRGAVGNLRGVAGGDLAVFLEGRLELGEALGGRTIADAFVVRDGNLFAVQVDLDWNDLVFESAFVARYCCSLLALGAEGVEVLAGDAVLVGDHVGADSLRRETGLGVTVLLVLAEREAHALNDRGAHRGAGHHFDTSGNNDVVRTGHDALGSEVHRLLRGAALAVDGG